MANFYDISTWAEQPFYNTGGTRNKCIVEEPKTGALYFFKTSLKKGAIDYKYEFWSEIIASEIGNAFGFKVLHYNIGFNGSDLGCLSQSMIGINEQLVEGYKILTGYDNTYNPEDKSIYTFQLIEKALENYRHKEFVEEIIKTIIFDSIIGNSDRHQENWGVIEIIQIDNMKSPLQKISFWRTATETHVNKSRYSLIYDSGSCLGRELSDARVHDMLNDQQKINAYIKRGSQDKNSSRVPEGRS